MGKQRPEMHHTRDDGAAERKERRLDLSVPQVAGSALAAVAAAVLASRLGVYGTILGAGVMSVVATCGGSLFQHLFRRTGEQIRDVTRQTGSKGRRPPAGSPEPEPAAYGEPRGHGEFGAATVHGTRARGRKRCLLAAAVVFAVAMLGITGYELASGRDLGGGRGTTVGTAVRGGGESSAGDESPSPPGPQQSRDGGRYGQRGGEHDGTSGTDDGSGAGSGAGDRGGSGTEGDGRGGSGSASGSGPGNDGGEGDRPSSGPSASADDEAPAAPQDSAPSAPAPAGSTRGTAPDAP
ncbi:hypothetical protein [Streptomyces sp. WMMC940]|uniref:hypothetical protein n=1 Tax=Streptomyces sp. WMMC940 TaxID=3015153 RepID=UPI0022B6EF42|nr:hypothetical protein [Streptomyces sp. WMMC940]MCZ7457543.1 hypothetical protein [Streptomyces sp. WMMC940]